MDSDWDIIIISRSVDEDKGVLHTVHVHYIIKLSYGPQYHELIVKMKTEFFQHYEKLY
jgi:hypothetical protein